MNSKSLRDISIAVLFFTLSAMLAMGAVNIKPAQAAADELVRGAIAEVKTNHSDRVGKLLEAMNDKYLRERP